MPLYLLHNTPSSLGINIVNAQEAKLTITAVLNMKALGHIGRLSHCAVGHENATTFQRPNILIQDVVCVNSQGNEDRHRCLCRNRNSRWSRRWKSSCWHTFTRCFPQFENTYLAVIRSSNVVLGRADSNSTSIKVHGYRSSRMLTCHWTFQLVCYDLPDFTTQFINPDYATPAYIIQ